VFRRGRDLTPRGDVASIYRVLMNDDGPVAAELLSYPKKAVAKLPLRLQLARALLQAAQNPRRAMILLEQMADRLEGKPVQKVKTDSAHMTVFYKAGDPPLGLPSDGTTQPQVPQEP
jgi:hypothetical protein